MNREKTPVLQFKKIYRFNIKFKYLINPIRQVHKIKLEFKLSENKNFILLDIFYIIKIN
jgi:hypothetical protein